MGLIEKGLYTITDFPDNIMNYLQNLLIRLNYKTFFFLIIPTVNIVLGLMQYLSYNNGFDPSVLARELITNLLNPYFIGAIWLFMYATWKGSIKNKKQDNSIQKANQDLFMNHIDFETLNMDNYMKTVLYAWVLQIGFVIAGIL